MTRFHRESLAEQAADALLERIRGGEWELGQKVPGETTLAQQLGVGRSTIREAIRHLAARGVLATRQGAGVFVTALDVAEEWRQVLGRVDISAVIEARLAIEVEASSLAALRRTPAELRGMKRAVDERGILRSDIEAHVDSDTAFHRSIILAAHNPILTDLFDAFAPRSRQAMVDFLRIRGEHGSEADQLVHVRILDAITARDSESASSLTRDHLLSLKADLS